MTAAQMAARATLAIAQELWSHDAAGQNFDASRASKRTLRHKEDDVERNSLAVVLAFTCSLMSWV